MYHDLYLKTDVLLLCDVFEKLINQGIKYYRLDCSHYVSLPSFSWDAMLKFTGVRLEKVDDIDIHLFLEKGMRGGVSYISKRYSKSDKNTQLLYLDFNKLCGWAMGCNYLPYGSFRWLCQKEIDDFKLDSISENSLAGYILEVNLKYCWNLHDLHNDYPLAPEKIEVGYKMLSTYCKKIVDWYGIKVGGLKKLIPNLGDKIGYIVDYRNLKYYLSLGMKLVKIHRVLSFKQSNWLKSYIDFNTEKGKESTNEADKDYFKLVISCIFGKTIENIRERVNVKLVHDKTKIFKMGQ